MALTSTEAMGERQRKKRRLQAQQSTEIGVGGMEPALGVVRVFIRGTRWQCETFTGKQPHSVGLPEHHYCGILVEEDMHSHFRLLSICLGLCEPMWMEIHTPHNNIYTLYVK